VLTGNGLKDPATAIDNSGRQRFHAGLDLRWIVVASVMGLSEGAPGRQQPLTDLRDVEDHG